MTHFDPHTYTPPKTRTPTVFLACQIKKENHHRCRAREYRKFGERSRIAEAKHNSLSPARDKRLELESSKSSTWMGIFLVLDAVEYNGSPWRQSCGRGPAILTRRPKVACTKSLTQSNAVGEIFVFYSKSHWKFDMGSLCVCSVSIFVFRGGVWDFFVKIYWNFYVKYWG